MGFFDWIFAASSHQENPRLLSALDRILRGVDPRLQYMEGARERLLPAVGKALAFARETVAALPPGIELKPDNWARQPLLRAIFVRPSEIGATISGCDELSRFLAADNKPETLFGVLAATCSERTSLGPAMEGDELRQDVAQTSLSFSDIRLAGIAASEAGTRRLLEDFLLEQLAVAALAEISGERSRAQALDQHRHLLLTRLRLLEQGKANLGVLYGEAEAGADEQSRLRQELAANAEALAASRSGSGLESLLGELIDAMENAERILRPQRFVRRINAMNVVVGAEDGNAAEIALAEFTTASGRERRLCSLVSFPRQAFVEKSIDLDALLRSI